MWQTFITRHSLLCWTLFGGWYCYFAIYKCFTHTKC